MKYNPGKAILLLLFALMAACATTHPVRHLSSDVCLIMPGSTSKADVLSFLGQPDLREVQKNGDEVWSYYKKNENALQDLPGVGDTFGKITYETVTVTFIGNQVRTCIYRQLDQPEFDKKYHPAQ